mgnify:CR=1 FL=1
MTPDEIKSEAVLYCMNPFERTFVFDERSLVAFIQRVQFLARNETVTSEKQ